MTNLLKKAQIVIAASSILFTGNVIAMDNAELSPEDYFPVVTNPKHANPSDMWQVSGKPYPTSAWYVNLALKTEDDSAVGLRPIYPYPYSIASTTNGIAISLPKATFAEQDGKVFAQLYPYSAQITLGTSTPGSEITRKLLDAGELFADLQFRQSEQQSMHAPITRGSPYITLFYKEMTPLISPAAGIASVNQQPPGTTLEPSNRFEIKLALDAENSQTWIVYTETPVQLQWLHSEKGWQLQADKPYNGWVRIALLQDTKVNVNNSAALLDDNASQIPVKGEISYQYGKDDVTTTFNWKTQNDLPPLLMALPHQQSQLENSMLPADDISMQNTHGKMRGIISNQWHMKKPLPDITFLELNNPNSLDKNSQQAIIDAIKRDSTNISESLNPSVYGVYSSGKRFARAARLALLAKQFGLNKLSKEITDVIESNLLTWMHGKNDFQLQYDKTWGGIIPVKDDFGSQDYNDHHFHYGYFTYTFAVLAQLDSQWINKNITIHNKQLTPLQWITFLINDFANQQNNSQYFPYSRHSDAYDGHSWASGIGMAWQDGRNQESVSEAANAYYSIALLGKAVNNQKLFNWGRLLLAREIDGANHYYFIQKNSDLLGPEYTNQYSIVTNLWDGKADAHSWFGNNIEFSYGIEFLPFTANTTNLISPAWLTENYSRLKAIYQGLPEDNVGWKWFMLKAAFMASPATDYDYFWQQALMNGSYDEGDSQANTLYIIATGKK